MKRVNVTVALCDNYDESTKNVTGFYNQIETDEKEVELCVFTMVNYVGKERCNLQFDYFLKCIQSETLDAVGKWIPLFILDLKGNESTISSEYNVTEILFSKQKKVSFPGKGVYEIQVFLADDEIKSLKTARERNKEYKKNNITPNAIFRFVVK